VVDSTCLSRWPERCQQRTRWSNSLSAPGKRVPVRLSVPRWEARVSRAWTSARYFKRSSKFGVQFLKRSRNSTQEQRTLSLELRFLQELPSGLTDHSHSSFELPQHHGFFYRLLARRKSRTKYAEQIPLARKLWGLSHSNMFMRLRKSSNPR
jgi:hypothetical protein